MKEENKIKILFIDDDKATNFLNRHLTKSCKSIQSVYLMHSGFEAISFLENCASDVVKRPNVIFLDINMPAMNGWEFLEKFYQLDESLVKDTKIFILSSSDDPADLSKFHQNKKLLGFIRKPLNKKALGSVLKNVEVE